MIHMLNRIILYLLLLGVVLSTDAQQYGYTHYNAESGAPFNKVSSVIEDESGFVWIGSSNGLYRFDGMNFDLYSIHTKSQFIHQLHKNENQILFVNDLGIYQVDHIHSNPKATSIIEGNIKEKSNQPFYPNDFLIDKNQNIWLSQSNHSIGRLHHGVFKTYKLSESKTSQKISICMDAQGGIWALSILDGLLHYDTASDTFKNVLNLKGGITLSIHNDYLLIGKKELLVYKINGNKIQFLKKIELDNHHISAIYINENEHYIIGTEEGELFTFSNLNKPPQTIYGANEAHRIEELDFGHVYEIYTIKDSVGNNENLWVCSENGLWLLQERFFKIVKSLPMVNPIGIAIGNNENAYVPINHLFKVFPIDDEFEAKTILDNLQVSAVAQDNEENTWVSVAKPKVAILKYHNEKLIKQYDDFHGRDEGIFNLYPDSKGNLWFCQSPANKPIFGIAVISADGEVKIYDETKGFASRVLAIKESNRGEIYAAAIGEKAYLYKLDQEKDEFINLSPNLPFKAKLNFEAHDLTIDDRGIVWLATTDGLLRYDAEKVSLIQDDILGQEEVRGVTHYSNNNIWVSTATKGLVFHHKNISTILGETEGLPAIISAYRCITTDAKGRLWAGTAEGLVYSRTTAASLPYSNPPNVRKIIVNQEELNGEFRNELNLKKNQELKLLFTNLTYPAINVQYQYRLLLKEEKQLLLEEHLWESIGNKNTLTLSEIEIGNYYLELRARQPGGYQWSEPTEIELNVYQPWYLQKWFFYTSIGLLIIFISYYFRFYVRRRFNRLQEVLKYSNEKLEQKEAQLHQKIIEFKKQQEVLANANLNILTLELFIKKIHKNASWDDIITAMGKAVEQSKGINAFEIAFMLKNEIFHRGYSNIEKGGYTIRNKAFNSKTSLTCWAMSNNKEVLINDFGEEHPLYIEEKETYRYNSLLFIPFTLDNKQSLVLCAYSIHKNHFDQNDLVMFRILSQFIYLSINKEITNML